MGEPIKWIDPDKTKKNFEQAIINFAYHLNNEHKFNISIDTIITAINNIGDIDVFDKTAMREILKTILCKSSTEFSSFDEIFCTYFSNTPIDTYNEIVEKIRTEEIDKVAESFPSREEAVESVGSDTAEDTEFLKYESEIRDAINKMHLDIWQENDLVNACKKDHDAVREMICRHMLENDDRYSIVKKNLESLMKLCINDRISNETVLYLLLVGEYMQQVFNTIKDILNKRDQAMNAEMAEIEKAMSSIHRDEFIYGKNAVRTYADILEANLTTLSNSEMVKLSQYIRQNAYKFKTKIAMNMKKSENQRIDFKKTVKRSIRADGVPYKIERQKPIPTKTKIISICDVSGSCIKSAKILLTFLYELQSVFPGGCESFVFISDLANVTSIFKEMDIDEACSKAVSMVPRRYSNYDTALTMFSMEYMSHISKDTIVIFLGDARNNNNPTGQEVVAAIKQRAKKVYWLETEPRGEWGESDSAIYAYAPYVSEIKEILKPHDLVDFLCNVTV